MYDSKLWPICVVMTMTPIVMANNNQWPQQQWQWQQYVYDKNIIVIDNDMAIMTWQLCIDLTSIAPIVASNDNIIDMACDNVYWWWPMTIMTMTMMCDGNETMKKRFALLCSPQYCWPGDHPMTMTVLTPASRPTTRRRQAGMTWPWRGPWQWPILFYLSVFVAVVMWPMAANQWNGGRRPEWPDGDWRWPMAWRWWWWADPVTWPTAGGVDLFPSILLICVYWPTMTIFRKKKYWLVLMTCIYAL